MAYDRRQTTAFQGFGHSPRATRTKKKLSPSYLAFNYVTDSQYPAEANRQATMSLPSGETD